MSVSCGTCGCALPRIRPDDWEGCYNCAEIRAARAVNAEMLVVLKEVLKLLQVLNSPPISKDSR